MNSVIFSYDLYAQGMPPMSQANYFVQLRAKACQSSRFRNSCFPNPRWISWCGSSARFSTQSFMFPTEQTFDGVSIGHEVQTSYNANVQDDQIVHVSGAGVSLVN
uniref:Uncharacterized protein n=1 Tax=Ditylenchus dipsaci TaxID=166011 RepID=A0A915E190_9BILA